MKIFQNKNIITIVWIINIGFLILSVNGLSQNIVRTYQVSHINTMMTIDGKLDESVWQTAPFTEKFVLYTDGSSPVMSTIAQMLWDSTNIYFAFKALDTDIWATKTHRDEGLWREEAVELFIDPDGDGLNYIEIQINPLGTVCDILLDKEFSKGGIPDHQWNLKGFKTAVSLNGTVNDEKADIEWFCEIAIPFQSLSSIAPACQFPPNIGDSWRINLCRMETDRFNKKNIEATAWNQTDRRGFHAPDLFGKIVFFGELKN